MKKILSILLAAFLVCSLGLIAYADPVSDAYTEIFEQKMEETGGYDGYEMYPLSVPTYRNIDILSPDMIYDSMLEGTTFRAAPLMKDGVAVGMITFVIQDGEWSVAGSEESGSELYDAIMQYGTDFLYIGPNGKQIVLESDKNTIYNLSSVATASTQQLALADYVSAVSYYNVQPKEPGLLNGGMGSIDNTLIQEANEYWASQQTTSMTPWILLAVAVLAVGVVTVVIVRRKKAAK